MFKIYPLLLGTLLPSCMMYLLNGSHLFRPQVPSVTMASDGMAGNIFHTTTRLETKLLHSVEIPYALALAKFHYDSMTSVRDIYPSSSHCKAKVLGDSLADNISQTTTSLEKKVLSNVQLAISLPFAKFKDVTVTGDLYTHHSSFAVSSPYGILCPNIFPKTTTSQDSKLHDMQLTTASALAKLDGISITKTDTCTCRFPAIQHAPKSSGNNFGATILILCTCGVRY